MEAKDLNSQLIKMIPSIQNKFAKICDDIDGLETGSTIVMEDVLLPFTVEAIEKDDSDAIQKVSNFIEWLSDYYDDEYAGDVLVISIYEAIHCSPNKKKLEMLLGEKAKKQYESISWK